MAFNFGDRVMVRPTVGNAYIPDPDHGGAILTAGTEVSWSPYWIAMLAKGNILAIPTTSGSVGSSASDAFTAAVGQNIITTAAGFGLTPAQVFAQLATYLTANGYPVSGNGASSGSGTGAVQAQSALTGAALSVAPVSAVGVIGGRGALSATPSTVGGITASGTIPAGGALSGAASATGSYAGAIQGQGALSASAAVAIAANGNIPGQGAFGGAAGTAAVVNASGAIPAPSGPAGAASVTASQGLVQTRKGRLVAAMAA